MMMRWHIEIEGRVQGVFYRKSTKEKADSLGLSGWVKNEPNGAVTAEAEGDESTLKALVDWCHVGPPAAQVSSVKVTEVELQGDSGFSVRH